MAEVEENPKVINEEDEYKEEEKIIQHYSSFHRILLVGDGDFSFSLCLAQFFGSASNIVASSLQLYGNFFLLYFLSGLCLFCLIYDGVFAKYEILELTFFPFFVVVCR